MKLRIPATLERLEEARAFVQSHAETLGVSPAVVLKLDLVLEELVVNIGSYAYPDSGGDMEINCTRKALDDGREVFCLSMRDWGARFDPLEAAAPDTGAGLEERGIGGLGIYLIREMAAHCEYIRHGDMNEFTVCLALD
ncbi:ATP-binding protein [Salidesulfovibrio onnuriiensis]|uniref:ATP-binding protein n=1 Tax=Salidesulfovibrio onnuriiensis TaxID=2583823 RepID=UPI0011C73B67|nr:ATP-binding protein [Salidesulfovibrio onnuriiensis]